MVTRGKANSNAGSETSFDNGIAKEVLAVGLEDEMEKSFLAYSYLTIEDRAIPDARDGMKPVQRRILYSMFESGTTPDKPYVKSAKTVGNVMGQYHPHGDSAIYEAKVRMAQDFSLMVPLIDGRGNFGDRPGAGAASSRYTESRLSKAALPLVSELRERSVDFVPNYDQTSDQPSVLPVQFPALTINGASGIAVGYATNMAPHNPGEVIDATRWLLTHPSASLDKLMEFVPGPDFPTGGQVFGLDGAREAYETGQGKVTIRSPYRVESKGRGKNLIVFYELPYAVNSESIMEKIKEGIKSGKLQGIADVKDLTDRRNGIRFVIETKVGVNPKVLAETLYKNTPLESGFSFNNIALVGGVPMLLGLKEQLEIFIEHRTETVLRRSKARKEKRQARLHLIEGLLKALANIDKVIKIVRTSDDASAAQSTLMSSFKIDDVQADYILGIPLRRLTKFDQLELSNEKAGLENEIAALDKIINDDKELRAVIGKELADVRKQIDTPRRSVLIDGKAAAKLEEEVKAAAKASVEVADEPITVFLTRDGKIVAGKSAPAALLSKAGTTTRGKFVAVSNKGRGWRIDTLHVPNRAADVEKSLPEKLDAGEKIVAVTPVALDEGKTGGIAMGTKNGVVKVCSPAWPVRSDEFSVFKLDGDDEILSARWVDDAANFEFVFMTSESNLLRFGADKVRPQGLTGGGMAGVKVPEGASVVSFDVVSADEVDKAAIVTVADSGRGKVSPFKDVPVKGRATGGVRTLKFLRGDNEVKFGFVGLTDTLLGEGGSGKAELPKLDPRRDGSGKAMPVPVR